MFRQMGSFENWRSLLLRYLNWKECQAEVSFSFEYILIVKSTHNSEDGHNTDGRIRNGLIIKSVTSINKAILDCYCIVQAKPEAKGFFNSFCFRFFLDKIQLITKASKCG
ncbi:hypothetical protein D3C85_1456140 [compost metagenome]